MTEATGQAEIPADIHSAIAAATKATLEPGSDAEKFRAAQEAVRLRQLASQQQDGQEEQQQTTKEGEAAGEEGEAIEATGEAWQALEAAGLSQGGVEALRHSTEPFARELEHIAGLSADEQAALLEEKYNAVIETLFQGSEEAAQAAAAEIEHAAKILENAGAKIDWQELENHLLNPTTFEQVLLIARRVNSNPTE